MSTGEKRTGPTDRRQAGSRPGPPQSEDELLRIKPVPPLDRSERLKNVGRWLLTGHRPEPAPSRLGVLAEGGIDRERVGICCSGGGIRSASFNLGALQALQHDRELERSKYLAAVSGGSYMAASVCMVAKTWPRGGGPAPGPRPTENAPGHDDSDPSIVSIGSPPFRPGSPEEQYLRNRVTYMAPTGLDKIFLVWRILMGLAVNTVLVGLPLFVIGTALAVFVYRPFDSSGPDTPFIANEPGWVWRALIGLLVLAVALGLVAVLRRPRSDLVRGFLEIWSTRLLVLLAVAALFLVAVPELVQFLKSKAWPEEASIPAGAGSFGGLLVAALLQLRSSAASDAKVATTASRAVRLARRASPKVRRAAAYGLAAVAGPALLLAILAAGASVALTESRGPRPSALDVASLVGPIVAFGFFYLVLDLSTWSLHPFYKRRLCTAFALKRVKDETAPPTPAPQEKAVERDYDRLVPLSESSVWPGPGDEGWPTLLVCAAANISDPGATAPGRGVTSFTFSPAAIGGPLVGGLSTREYERRLGSNLLPHVTLPAAVAMSGAAISPSMGKMTRAPLRLLMALANLRLGVWVPNPRWVAHRWKQRTVLLADKASEDRHSGIEKVKERPADLLKRPRLSHLFFELIGRNRADARFLYVTDGGHYENLGLVELLRRGCGTIYCFDASGGRPAEALGDAVALARSELGVEIEIDPAKVTEDGDGFAKESCAVGRIRHGDEEVGRLVYAPTVLTRNAPWDVRAYDERDPVFPHHSTADQLYDDQRFEAYRALGQHAGERALKALVQAQRLG